MADGTKTYKYTSNKDHTDGTEEIRLPGRDPVAKGGTIELTEAEYAQLKGRLNLHEVEGSNDSSPERQGNANQGSEKSETAK